ncbi:MAG TPA: hypothetical protein DGM69_06605 [Chloroflexi bacterium]|nr:hypothetical protein [Chloroflexota bacterium]
MTKSTFAKTKAQIKSSRYYLFWGAATVAVVVGQIYVGTGYRNMSESLDRLIDFITAPKPRTMPVPGPRYETLPSAPDDYNMPIIQ